MFNSAKTKVIALALVGVVALGGAIYATSALAAGGATAAPATVVTTAQAATDPQLRANILDMLKDRMGLTGADAEKFADQMIARMQSANPNFDFKAMVNWCSQFINTSANGRGMMGATGSAYCRGMMGGGTTPDGESSGPSGTSSQASGSGVTPRGMMRGGMMGASGLK
jgi:hypothetical protein